MPMPSAFLPYPSTNPGHPPRKKTRCSFWFQIFPRGWGGYRAVLVKQTGKYSAFTRCRVTGRPELNQDAGHTLRSQKTLDLEASDFTTAGSWPLFWSLEVRVTP